MATESEVPTAAGATPEAPAEPERAEVDRGRSRVSDERPELRVVGDDEALVPTEAAAPDKQGVAAGDHPSSLGRVTDDSDRASTHERSSEALDHAVELLASVDAEDHYKSLLALTRPGQSEILQPLPYNPALEFHDPRCVKVDPEPVGLETILLYARAAYPDFDRVLLDAFEDPVNDHLFNHLEHLLLTERENVALVTNHGQIIDIALVIGALLAAVTGPDRRFGVLGDRVGYSELAPHLNVVVSRMVATRQALGVPAMQVLQGGCRTFLSIPQTASRRRARLDPAMVKANNLVMRHELDLQMAKGGQLLAMAASGTQDLSIAAGLMKKARDAWLKRRGEEPPEETATLHLQPLYDGTMSLMRSCHYVLPIAICLDPSTPACVLGELTRLRERDDCHRVMDWIAEAHQSATGIPTIYHWNEDDLLTHARSLAESLRR